MSHSCRKKSEKFIPPKLSVASPLVSHSSSRPTHNTFQNNRLPQDGICYKPLYNHCQPCAGPLYLRGRPTSRALSLRPMLALFMSSISCPPVSSFMLFHNQVWIKSRQGQDRIRPGSTSCVFSLSASSGGTVGKEPRRLPLSHSSC